MADEPSELLRRVISIDHKTNSMEDSLAWLVRASGPELKAELVGAFGKSERRAAVYLALDGKRKVNQIAEALGMEAHNVSRELRWLKEKGLVDVVELRGAGYIYKKKAFDKIVGLSKALAETFARAGDGRRAK